MADTTPRVVILGAAGEAQQQLLNALNELGAHTLAVGDFDQLDPVQLRQQKPDVWLVSIDEGTDSGRLERWQPLFDDPDATVIFDDADVTRRLSGWDLARWARHLAAKVLGRDNVLPPVSPDAERLPQPAPGDAAASTLDDDAAFAALNASFEAERTRTRAAPAPSLDDLLNAHAAEASGFNKPPPVQPAAANGAVSAAQPTGPAPAAQAQAKVELSLLGEDVPVLLPRVSKPAEPVITIDVSRFELEPLEAVEQHHRLGAQGVGEKKTVLPAKGIIAIISGLGGPDSVRQFLGGLPSGLTVPVLLWQHLDAGKHDRLAQQLAKSTKLPVYLPKPGELARAGEVGVMGVRMGVHDDEDWWINEGSPSPSHALAPSLKHPGTVLVVLSGAEPVIVEFARNHKANGGTVLVQTSATCFDSTATAALEGQGLASGSPSNLAERAVERVNAK
ncbi:MAG TPA: chemotaxis protein CheB [Xanthomonadaceae bacterium]|jgi:chemosensory pili system protein ChpB (putative protein-glutamate methylesterase)|nr:chemotaxis protein CheB [Xanthomonadaceae bacterium]